jgi:hypothetical protein
MKGEGSFFDLGLGLGSHFFSLIFLRGDFLCLESSNLDLKNGILL